MNSHIYRMIVISPVEHELEWTCRHDKVFAV